jgi:xylan 1,4-beta-xylosidase
MAVNFDQSFDYDRSLDVRIHLQGLAQGKWLCKHYRIDRDHSNAYTVWLSMGRPVVPDDAQLAILEERMGLELLEPAYSIACDDGDAALSTVLPPQSVSVWVVEPA